MNASKVSALFLGVIGMGVGAIGILAGLGYLPKGRGDPTIPMVQQQAVAICIGAAFAAAGVSALLTAWPGRVTRIARTLLGFIVVLGLTAVFGWVAIGSGSRGFSSPLAIFGNRVNDIGGRIMFGFGALMGLLFLVRMSRGVGRTSSED
jgi:hypothetical protein